MNFFKVPLKLLHWSCRFRRFNTSTKTFCPGATVDWRHSRTGHSCLLRTTHRRKRSRR